MTFPFPYTIRPRDIRLLAEYSDTAAEMVGFVREGTGLEALGKLSKIYFSGTEITSIRVEGAFVLVEYAGQDGGAPTWWSEFTFGGQSFSRSAFTFQSHPDRPVRRHYLTASNAQLTAMGIIPNDLGASDGKSFRVAFR